VCVFSLTVQVSYNEQFLGVCFSLTVQLSYSEQLLYVCFQSGILILKRISKAVCVCVCVCVCLCLQEEIFYVNNATNKWINLNTRWSVCRYVIFLSLLLHVHVYMHTYCLKLIELALRKIVNI